MNGVEYILLHCQDPILYVIRKQKRSSPKQGRYLKLAKSLSLTIPMIKIQNLI